MKMNPNKHGFKNTRSCLSRLLEHYDLILSRLENGHYVDAIYLDFSKAFDKVDIGIFCHKMKLLPKVLGKTSAGSEDFLLVEVTSGSAQKPCR
jgi:hypothetical protein